MVSCKWDQTSVAVSVSDRDSGSKGKVKGKAAKAASSSSSSSAEDAAAEPLALFGSRAGGENGIEWAESGLLVYTGGPVREPCTRKVTRCCVFSRTRPERARKGEPLARETQTDVTILDNERYGPITLLQLLHLRHRRYSALCQLGTPLL
jgi:hypothetical protein